MNKILILFLMAFTALRMSAEDTKFEAKSSGVAVVGDPFYLQYELNKQGTNLRPPAFDGFQQKAGPTMQQSSSYQFINGKSSRTQSFIYTYVLVAQKEGTYTIPPATIEVDGKKLTSNSLTIKVVAANQQTGQGSSSQAGISNRDIFIRTTVNKSNPYQQDAVLFTLKLYTRVDVSNITNADIPEFNGFLTQDIENKSGSLVQNVETYNGLTYKTYVIQQKVLFPQRSGEITIKPVKVNLNIRMRTQRRSYNIFDDLFDSYQDVSKQLSSNEVTLNVKPLPSPQPAGFRNLVGDFSLKSSITSEDVKENDPVTVKLVLSGEGNLKMLPTPDVEFPEDFEKFNPKISNNLNTTAAGVNGSRTFEYLVIPRFGGDFIIPAVKIPYFDPQTGRYKTLSSQEFNIHVEKGDGTTTPGVNQRYTSKEDVKYLGTDIRYIKTSNLKLRAKGDFLFGSASFWLWLGIPVVLYIIIFIVYRKQARQRANVALVKNKRANKVARKRLKAAADYMKKEDKEAFYEEVLRAMWGYTSDKLNIPLSRLNKDNIEDILRGKGISEERVKEFIELLNTCEYARYAPSAVAGGMDETYKNAVSVISNLDNKL
ncbi:BatD family protein [Saccharicrinis sp. FJH54]|uniref:BatD family protein n=1 Tax=Saccharicrinis sp. FJH54 TaxID=3344665 RepID=UPI0035D3EB3D